MTATINWSKPIRTIPKEVTQQKAAHDLIARISQAAAKEDGGRELALLINDKVLEILSYFITEDDKMLEMKERCKKLAYKKDPVLITGPSGTGKNILARALHGLRNDADFYMENCAALPDNLIESELFGHIQGAFTGASRDRIGILEAAGDGTVFLDEIGDASPSLQAKLLNALQPDYRGQRYIRPVGSNVTRPIHCRIIAATKKDLFELTKAGLFREDLFGRLMTWELHTSALRDRPADIQLILNHLGVPAELREEIDNPYWSKRIDLFNVRALQAYALRAKEGMLI